MSKKYSGGLEKFLLSLQPVAKFGEVLLWIMASPGVEGPGRAGSQESRAGSRGSGASGESGVHLPQKFEEKEKKNPW
jgi:hypothetical protein